MMWRRSAMPLVQIDLRVSTAVSTAELVDCRNHHQAQVEEDQTNSLRVAGGVAVYTKIIRKLECRILRSDNPTFQECRIGELSMVEILVGGQLKFILITVYIHPRVTKSDMDLFFRCELKDLAVCSRNMSSAAIDPSIPIMLTGDFNFNIRADDWILEFMKTEFDLTYVASPHPTTLGNTYIDLTFVRNLTASCMPFVSYFSYHRPLFTKLSML